MELRVQSFPLAAAAVIIALLATLIEPGELEWKHVSHSRFD